MADETWDTEDELNFLAHLGAHCWLNVGNSERRPADRYGRIALLTSYLETMKSRVRWNGPGLDLDPLEIASFVTQEIRELMLGREAIYSPPLPDQGELD